MVHSTDPSTAHRSIDGPLTRFHVVVLKHIIGHVSNSTFETFKPTKVYTTQSKNQKTISSFLEFRFHKIHALIIDAMKPLIGKSILIIINTF